MTWRTVTLVDAASIQGPEDVVSGAGIVVFEREMTDDMVAVSKRLLLQVLETADANNFWVDQNRSCNREDSARMQLERDQIDELRRSMVDLQVAAADIRARNR